MTIFIERTTDSKSVGHSQQKQVDLLESPKANLFVQKRRKELIAQGVNGREAHLRALDEAQANGFKIRRKRKDRG